MAVNITCVIAIKAKCDNCGLLEKNIVIADDIVTALSKMPIVREKLGNQGWQLSDSALKELPNNAICQACSRKTKMLETQDE